MTGICLNYQQKNYGSKLQALATIAMFDRLGLEYEIIQYNKKTLRFILKYLLRCGNVVFINDRFFQIQRRVGFRMHPDIKVRVDGRDRLFDDFDTQFTAHLSPKFSSYEQLKEVCPHRYDKVITCSDQLWSPSALGSGFYNLMFAPEDMNKISWASSFGVSNIPWYQVRRTKKYLQRIQHISMREKRGAEIVKELTGQDVPVLMDPVFAFSKEEWEQLIPVDQPEWQGYIFCYFLGNNPKHRDTAKRLAEETGKKIITIRHLDEYVQTDETFGDYAPYNVSPARFLNILRNADYVCTDSFHGMAFSVIHQKNFLVFDRYRNASANSKNSRIDSLCDILQLSDRRISDEEEICTALDCEIDYSYVKRMLSRFHKETMEYLHSALSLR